MSRTSSRAAGVRSTRVSKKSRVRATEDLDTSVKDLAASSRQLNKLVAEMSTASLPKVRRTLTLDADVVAAFADTPSLSAEVNMVLREELRRRVARAELETFVARLDAEFGAPDPAEVEHFVSLLRE
ncbi:MAG: hypothetical protein ACRDLT_10795 [Solirubrobacteraceae bacterium]